MAITRSLYSAIGPLAIRRQALATTRLGLQRRTAAQLNPTNANPSSTALLAAQRLARPTAPHLSIYRPQITWYGSALHRITGVALSGALYVFAVAYLAAPTLGWHLESTAVALSFAAWPLAAKVAAKMTLAAPFFFHCVNGLRHLSWDVSVGFAKQTVVRTGWMAVGASALLTVYYSLFV